MYFHLAYFLLTLLIEKNKHEQFKQEVMTILSILWCSAGFTECLVDSPHERKYTQPLHHAEQVARYYDVNKQCKLSFGKDYAICPFMVMYKKCICQ